MIMSFPTTTRRYYLPQPGSFENLTIQEVPVSAPAAGEVLVKTHAVSLQFRDLLVAAGRYGSGCPPNLVPCSDMAGEIIAVGEGVKEWKTGDRICANFMVDKLHDGSPGNEALGGAVNGVLTEYRTFPAQALVAIPEHLSYDEASTLPCAALTAYNALLCGIEPLKAGDTILVQGTGGVSIFALQFAVASGATVIATSSSDEKLKIATKLGAKHVINYKTTPKWSEEVLRLTNGAGVDCVIEAIPIRKCNARSIHCLHQKRRKGGCYRLCWQCADVKPADIIIAAIGKQLSLRGIYVGSVVQFKNMNRLLSANPEKTKPVIDRVFEFNEAKAAYTHLKSQTHVGKVVIRF
ncbi:alcohol dehydrogenase superfamily protein [Favolaschia claudopus]|uniref:Alcohol dehydrogenase superfamily protein n=1 Tax=Favolaschia claudopus TaxID=2862362 RepID=A0AAV9ZQK9_9AGAR